MVSHVSRGYFHAVGKGNMVCKLWLLVVGKALSDNWNVEASKEGREG